MRVACCIANNNLIHHTTSAHEYVSVVCSPRLTAAPHPARITKGSSQADQQMLQSK